MTKEKRKICFITGSRADYGILSTVMKPLAEVPSVCLQVIATNMHLSERFGETYKEIEADGFSIDRKVAMDSSGDNPIDSVKAVGEGCIGFADALSDLDPDLVVLLGDRYELLAAASAATILGIPIAHLHGGEITEGAIDDSIRHAITKLSYLHFTSTEEYRNRVIQLGEAPERVFNVGSPSIQNIDLEHLLSGKELERDIDFDLGDKYLVVTYHPVTREVGEAKKQIDALLNSLETNTDGYKLLFTLPNSDAEGRAIADAITEWTRLHPEKGIAVKSLGRKRFFSALKHASAMIGNSSSGLIEAPLFRIPTLNIGNRQKGRMQGNTVLNCDASQDSISHALKKVLSPEFRESVTREGISPYFKKGGIEKIIQVLTSFPLSKHPAKQFYDIKN